MLVNVCSCNLQTVELRSRRISVYIGTLNLVAKARSLEKFPLLGLMEQDNPYTEHNCRPVRSVLQRQLLRGAGFCYQVQCLDTDAFILLFRSAMSAHVHKHRMRPSKGRGTSAFAIYSHLYTV